MDLSALIFVALAVAWAVYLIPKALKHHDDVIRSRSVDRFSDTMRVLARREPVSRGSARLVVTPGRPASTPVVATKGASPTAAPASSRRQSSAAAARRRLRVVVSILALNVVVLALAGLGVVAWWYVAVTAGALVSWLTACRLMVKQERAVRSSDQSPVLVDEIESVDSDGEIQATQEIAVTDAAPVAPVDRAAVPVDPDSWDPVPVTLPTYVTKPAATRRTVRTIDLDATGVWTSGRTDADSQLVRDAAESDRADRDARKAEDDRRAVGS